MTNECEHGECHWVKIQDAEGDLSEAHLTRHFTAYTCTVCGEYTTEEPEDFEEDEPDYDLLMDRYYDDYPDY